MISLRSQAGLAVFFTLATSPVARAELTPQALVYRPGPSSRAVPTPLGRASSDGDAKAEPLFSPRLQGFRAPLFEEEAMESQRNGHATGIPLADQAVSRTSTPPALLAVQFPSVPSSGDASSVSTVLRRILGKSGTPDDTVTGTLPTLANLSAPLPGVPAAPQKGGASSEAKGQVTRTGGKAPELCCKGGFCNLQTGQTTVLAESRERMPSFLESILRPQMEPRDFLGLENAVCQNRVCAGMANCVGAAAGGADRCRTDGDCRCNLNAAANARLACPNGFSPDVDYLKRALADPEWLGNILSVMPAADALKALEQIDQKLVTQIAELEGQIETLEDSLKHTRGSPAFSQQQNARFYQATLQRLRGELAKLRSLRAEVKSQKQNAEARSAADASVKKFLSKDTDCRAVNPPGPLGSYLFQCPGMVRNRFLGKSPCGCERQNPPTTPVQADAVCRLIQSRRDYNATTPGGANATAPYDAAIAEAEKAMQEQIDRGINIASSKKYQVDMRAQYLRRLEEQKKFEKFLRDQAELKAKGKPYLKDPRLGYEEYKAFLAEQARRKAAGESLLPDPGLDEAALEEDYRKYREALLAEQARRKAAGLPPLPNPEIRKPFTPRRRQEMGPIERARTRQQEIAIALQRLQSGACGTPAETAELVKSLAEEAHAIHTALELAKDPSHISNTEWLRRTNEAIQLQEELDQGGLGAARSAELQKRIADLLDPEKRCRFLPFNADPKKSGCELEMTPEGEAAKGRRGGVPSTQSQLANGLDNIKEFTVDMAVPRMTAAEKEKWDRGERVRGWTKDQLKSLNELQKRVQGNVGDLMKRCSPEDLKLVSEGGVAKEESEYRKAYAIYLAEAAAIVHANQLRRLLPVPLPPLPLPTPPTPPVMNWCKSVGPRLLAQIKGDREERGKLLNDPAHRSLMEAIEKHPVLTSLFVVGAGAVIVAGAVFAPEALALGAMSTPQLLASLGLAGVMGAAFGVGMDYAYQIAESYDHDKPFTYDLDRGLASAGMGFVLGGVTFLVPAIMPLMMAQGFYQMGLNLADGNYCSAGVDAFFALALPLLTHAHGMASERMAHNIIMESLGNQAAGRETAASALAAAVRNAIRKRIEQAIEGGDEFTTPKVRADIAAEVARRFPELDQPLQNLIVDDMMTRFLEPIIRNGQEAVKAADNPCEKSCRAPCPADSEYRPVREINGLLDDDAISRVVATAEAERARLVAEGKDPNDYELWVTRDGKVQMRLKSPELLAAEQRAAAAPPERVAAPPAPRDVIDKVLAHEARNGNPNVEVTGELLGSGGMGDTYRVQVKDKTTGKFIREYVVKRPKEFTPEYIEQTGGVTPAQMAEYEAKVYGEIYKSDAWKRREAEREKAIKEGKTPPPHLTLPGVRYVDGVVIMDPIYEVPPNPQTGAPGVLARTLADRLDEFKISCQDPESLARWQKMALQYLQNMKELNEAGIVNRDVKPANILVDENGNLIPFDFGFGSTSVNGDRSQRSRIPTEQDGWVFGTPGYMTPEQWSGMPYLDNMDAPAAILSLMEMASGNFIQHDGVTPRLGRPDMSRVPARIREILEGAVDDYDYKRIMDDIRALRPADLTCTDGAAGAAGATGDGRAGSGPPGSLGDAARVAEILRQLRAQQLEGVPNPNVCPAPPPGDLPPTGGGLPPTGGGLPRTGGGPPPAGGGGASTTPRGSGSNLPQTGVFQVFPNGGGSRQVYPPPEPGQQGGTRQIVPPQGQPPQGGTRNIVRPGGGG